MVYLKFSESVNRLLNIKEKKVTRTNKKIKKSTSIPSFSLIFKTVYVIQQLSQSHKFWSLLFLYFHVPQKNGGTMVTMQILILQSSKHKKAKMHRSQSFSIQNICFGESSRSIDFDANLMSDFGNIHVFVQFSFVHDNFCFVYDNFCQKAPLWMFLFTKYASLLIVFDANRTSCFGNMRNFVHIL